MPNIQLLVSDEGGHLRDSGHLKYYQGVARRYGTSLDKVLPTIKRRLLLRLDNVIQKLRSRHRHPYRLGAKSGATLRMRSGTALASLNSNVTGSSLGRLRGGISGVGYLGIHETGGVITARKSQYLAIPLPAALNSDGTPKKPGPRHWEGAFVIESKRGNALIVLQKGRDLVPLYALKYSVKIPPRLGLGKTAVSELETFTQEAVDIIASFLSTGRV